MRIRRFDENNDAKLNVESAWLDLFDDAEKEGDFTINRKVIMTKGHSYWIAGEHRTIPPEPSEIEYKIIVNGMAKTSNLESFHRNTQTIHRIYEDVYVACTRTKDEFPDIDIKLFEERFESRTVLTVNLLNVDDYITHKGI